MRTFNKWNSRESSRCTAPGCRALALRGQAFCLDHAAPTVTEGVLRLLAAIPDRFALTNRIASTLESHCAEFALDTVQDRRAVATIVAAAVAKSLRQRV